MHRQTPIFAILLIAAATAFGEAHRPLPNSKSDTKSGDKSTVTWDKAAAARYLDSRQAWWQDWPHAQKDHGTVCVSCHTQVPYALARPALRTQLGEAQISAPEQAMLASILKRVALGNQATTFYTDQEHGPGKTKEARNAEAINNALILVSYDASTTSDPTLHQASLQAFNFMWALQEQSGDKSGAWLWQNFHFSPWEAPESEYYGAAEAALAIGIAPRNYANSPAIQPNLTLLRAYLKREYPTQPLINRLALLWASAHLSGLMTDQERQTLAQQVLAKQHPDGGWSLTDLGLNPQGQSTWHRHDQTPFDQRSDGFATGLVVLALEENGFANVPQIKRGLSWIASNQDKKDGLWPAWSVNVQRDPNSDVGKFMSDAATGFSVLALENSR